MRESLKKLKPDRFDDIIAMVSLYRPGPMDNIPTYINRKHGEEPVDCLHPLLEEILKETYGVIIYQEQVMQIAQVMGGYSLGKADVLRRAMGKKDKAAMAEQQALFVAGAKERGVKEKDAAEIFELVDKFAGYGFNKSHAAAYALVSYHTAYLKANYREEFLAASMTLDMANTDKLALFASEARKSGIEVKLPCVNGSAGGIRVGTARERRRVAERSVMRWPRSRTSAAGRSRRSFRPARQAVRSRISRILQGVSIQRRSTSVRLKHWRPPERSMPSRRTVRWSMAIQSRCWHLPTGCPPMPRRALTIYSAAGPGQNPHASTCDL